MTLYILLDRIRAYPLFTLEDCRKWFPRTTRQTLILQLSQYVKKGHLRRVKQGLYLSNQQPFPHPWAVASRIDSRCVISMESVLGRSGMLSEQVFATTAVTPGKPQQKTLLDIGLIRTRHMKSELFFGWNVEQFSPYAVKVAESEKALLDLLWFHRFEQDPLGYIQGLRLTIPHTFSWKRLSEYARLYNDARIDRLVEFIITVHTPRAKR